MAYRTLSIIAIGSLCLMSSAYAGSAHWGYSGEAGPDHWATLHADNYMCSHGKNQSPINLTDLVEADLPALELDYQTQAQNIVNNGHAIQVNMAQGSALKVDGLTLPVMQFHFHSPSENLIDGQSFPIEAHIVHGDGKGNFAVVAIMFEEGESNPVLESLWAHMPTQAHAKNALESVDLAQLLPENKDYYRFSGSLTTPPCSEGLRWLVFKNPVTASKAQIEQLQNAIGHPNNRPVQPVNARVILQ